MIIIRTCIIPSWRTISIFRNVSRSRIFAWGGKVLGHVFCLKAFRPYMLLVKVDGKILCLRLVTLNVRPFSPNFALIWLCLFLQVSLSPCGIVETASPYTLAMKIKTDSSIQCLPWTSIWWVLACVAWRFCCSRPNLLAVCLPSPAFITLRAQPKPPCYAG